MNIFTYIFTYLWFSSLLLCKTLTNKQIIKNYLPAWHSSSNGPSSGAACQVANSSGSFSLCIPNRCLSKHFFQHFWQSFWSLIGVEVWNEVMSWLSSKRLLMSMLWSSILLELSINIHAKGSSKQISYVWHAGCPLISVRHVCTLF